VRCPAIDLKSPAIAFLSNVAVFILKLFAALFTTSKAVFVEALRSFGDLLNSALVYTGSRIALKHEEGFDPFGKAMYLYVFSFAIGLLVLGSLVALGIFQTISALKSSSTILNTSLGIGLVSVALALDILSMVIAYRDEKRFFRERGYGNPLIKYIVFENIYDIVGGLTALATLPLSHVYPVVDVIASLALNAMLVVCMVRIVLESIEVLVYRAAPAYDIARAVKIALSNPAVRDVNTVKTFAIEPKKYAMFMDVELAPELSMDEVDQVIEEIKSEIARHVKNFTYIHIEPRKPDRDVHTHKKILELLARRRALRRAF
jgi:cation diffusion facilitator family transporter